MSVLEQVERRGTGAITLSPPGVGGEGTTPATLVMFLKRFPRLSETFVLNEILELRRQGVPVQIVAVTDPREATAQPEAAALVPEVIYLQGEPWPRRLLGGLATAARHPLGTARAVRAQATHPSRAGLRHLAQAFLLVRAIRRLGPVHVHAHFVHVPASVTYLAHLLSGVPFSFTAHAKDLYTTDVARVARRAKAAAFVVTCTEANRRYLEDVVGVDPARINVCRHGVDLRRFAQIERRPAPRQILSVGRLVPKKGFDVLIRACAELTRRGVDVDCRIVGDGPVRADLEKLVDELDLRERVRLERGRPQVELLSAYAEASVFVLSPCVQANGDRDGIPNVLQEALAAGVPVVTTAISGIPEVVRDGVNGRLVEPNDPIGLAGAIEELLHDGALRARLGTAARTLAAQEADLTECVRPLTAEFSASLSSVSGGSGRP